MVKRLMCALRRVNQHIAYYIEFTEDKRRADDKQTDMNLQGIKDLCAQGLGGKAADASCYAQGESDKHKYHTSANTVDIDIP